MHVVVAEEEQRYDVSYMESIHHEDLRKIVHYLRPLVQGIDFQSDMTTHWDVLPVFNALQSFYRSKTGDPQTPVDSASSVLFILPKGAVSDAFSLRIAFFTDEYPTLNCLRMRLLELFPERRT